jgi:hypothetical protein
LTLSTPYYFNVQRPFKHFWDEYGASNRKVLFIFGLGFDPRCVPALQSVANTFVSDCYVNTVCTRFTNLWDGGLKENAEHTRECLAAVRRITDALSGANYAHYEIEVNLFSDTREIIGAELLKEEFETAVGSRLSEFTEVIIDISAFPRVLMYSLLTHLWKKRQPGQNLFAVLTDVDINVPIVESAYFDPVFIFTPDDSLPEDHSLWIPILGNNPEPLQQIYEFLEPADVFPILPFPSRDPRRGDEIILKNKHLFETWKVPFTNIMYASAHVPFDIYRKIHEVVQSNARICEMSGSSIVVSAISGRSLSLGVLLAALQCNLKVCHIQPSTYKVPGQRPLLWEACGRATQTIYWLNGEVYD